MRRNHLAASLSFTLALVVGLISGCATPQKSPEQPVAAVKPIDRVREGIVSLQADLNTTLDSARAMADESRSDPRWSRSTFSHNLRSTEHGLDTLRADATELRQRASDYLAVWSGSTMMVTADSVAAGTDPGRAIVTAKYDQLVAALQAARDELQPLLVQLKAIESSTEPEAMRADVHEADVSGKRAVDDLQESLARLDELKALVQTKGD